MTKHRAFGLMVLVLAFAIASAACSAGSDPGVVAPPPESGLPRTFALGLSSLPSELTDESYADAFDLAGRSGEVILIRRTPPWAELLTDADFPSEASTGSTQREKALAREHGLELFVAIDATDVSEDTGQLAGLPPEMRGARFADEDVRQALKTYAQYVAVNYQPAYLALGVDVNAYERLDAADFEQFVIVYHEVYALIKEVSPDTLVFPTFQLEALHGLLPADEPEPPQWPLVNEFASATDLLAVSTYPGLAFSDPEAIPPDYFTTLAQLTDKPIAITEMGFPSSSNGGANENTEALQAAFLRRAMTDADRLAMPLVVWFAGRDPTFTGKPPFDFVQYLGLLRQDGTMKESWSVWTAAGQRRVEESSAAETPR